MYKEYKVIIESYSHHIMLFSKASFADAFYS